MDNTGLVARYQTTEKSMGTIVKKKLDFELELAYLMFEAMLNLPVVMDM